MWPLERDAALIYTVILEVEKCTAARLERLEKTFSNEMHVVKMKFNENFGNKMLLTNILSIL